MGEKQRRLGLGLLAGLLLVGPRVADPLALPPRPLPTALVGVGRGTDAAAMIIAAARCSG